MSATDMSAAEVISAIESKTGGDLEVENERLRQVIAQLRAGEGQEDQAQGSSASTRIAGDGRLFVGGNSGYSAPAWAENSGYTAVGEAKGQTAPAHNAPVHPLVTMAVANSHGERQAHGDGHDCAADHGSAGDAHGHGDKGHGDGGHAHGDGHDCGVDHGSAGDTHGHGNHAGGGHGPGAGQEGEMDMKALMAMLGKGAGKGGKGGGSGMDMASMMGGMAMGKEGLEDCSGAPPRLSAVEQRCNDLPTDEKKGDKWVWMQKGEEVHIRFPLDPPVASKTDIGVTFKTSTLKVLVRGESTLDGTLGGKVDVDDCTWCLSSAKDELQVMLTKTNGKTDAWPDLLA